MKEHIVEKNDIVELRIEDIGEQGEGIGKYNGYTLFIKDALIGDIVRAKVIKTKKSFGYGRVMEIVQPSPFRVEPRCKVARQCGGCQIQHLDYKEQLNYKENKVKNCLTRIGKFEPDLVDSIIEPIIGMDEPYYYRNKAQFPVGTTKEGKVVSGFYAGRTHSIIDTSYCCIQAEVNETIVRTVKEFIETYHISVYEEESHKGLIRHILTRVGYHTKEIMVCLVLNGELLEHSEKLIEKLKEIDGMISISLNVNTSRTNVILGSRIIPLWGKPYIIDYIGNVKYQISPLSFYQVNPVQTEKLYSKALEYADLRGDEVVWDIYCGIGTISLFLAKSAKKVYGIEIVEQAIEDAKRNAVMNGFENTEFIAGAAEEVVPSMFERGVQRADVVVLDPPRKGCEEKLLDTVVKMGAKRIVYVSCDPGSLARDLRYLADRGYEVKRGVAVDQFGHTVHVETVVLLSLKNQH